MVFYPNFKNIGIQEAISFGDGYSIQLTWNQAYVDNPSNKLAYHIYFSTDIDQVFNEGVKFISFDGYTTANILGFTPGQLYHFAVRAVEYDPTIINPALLPNPFNDLYVYPESMLSSNISATDGYVPLLDVSDFPPEGIVKVGGELIEYLAVNHTTNQLLVPTGSGNPAFIVQQSDGYYHRPSTNFGDGYINHLALVASTTITQTWTLKCVFVENDVFGADGYGPGYDGYARFVAIGSLSGELRDAYGEPFVWNTTNQVLSNGVLSFSVQQGDKFFALGDYFTVEVNAGTNPYAIGRGFYGTSPRSHNTDGYDGYLTWSPIVSFIVGKDEPNTVIEPCQSHFEFTNYAWTAADGYRQVVSDILTTNLSASDASNVGFNSYDYAGWHRTDLTLLLNGQCVGSYIGGQQYCADGYGGVGMQLRGISFQERMNQREEILLTVDSEPMVLIQRQWTGIPCDCYMPSGEYPDDRCPHCFPPGTLVRAENGLVPIETIKIGDRVLSSDGSYQKVKQVMKNRYDGVLQEISTTTTTQPILATPEHPFMVLRGSHWPTQQHGCGPNSNCKSFIKRGDGIDARSLDIRMAQSGKFTARLTDQNHIRRTLGTFITYAEAEQGIQDYKKIHFTPGHILSWNDACDIKQNDWLVTQYNRNIIDIETISIPQEYCKNTKLGIQRNGETEFIVDEEFMWIIGMYLAEGSCSKRSISFALHKNEVEYQNRIISFFAKYGYTSSIVPGKVNGVENNGVSVQVYSTSLSQWFPILCGRKCYNKHIAETFMNLPHCKTKALLRGIYDGDGSKRDHEITQTSRILALQIVELLHRHGEQPLVRRQQSKSLTPKGNKRRLAYCVSWKEDTFTHHNRKGRWDFNNYLLTKVKKSIQGQQYSGYVYNLEVEGDHTYVVENIVVHNCYGTKFVVGYNQYFNPRISDGRIMVRVGPADDLVKPYEAGLESEQFLDAWTLVVPTVKQRDILVRFDQADNEEFRYEVLSVQRNRTLNRLSGGQKFRLQRIRKTDPAYNIPVFRNTQHFPQTFNTGIGFINGIPHTHTVVLSENFPNGSPQLTSTIQGHNHWITLVNGVLTVGNSLDHTHSLTIPPLNPSDQFIFR